jgi:glycine cleavage system T protein
MGEILVEGINATTYLNYLVTNDVVGMKNHQAIYSPMCYENGGCIDDLLIYRISSTKYLLIVNASNIEKDYLWLNQHNSFEDVRLINVSEDYGLIALQGPKALEVIDAYTDINLNEMEYYHFKEMVSIFEQNVMVSRTGYTGEDGFEILGNQDAILKIFNGLLDNELVKPCGLGCRDTLRFEASMALYGHELSEKINPIEAGLKYFVKTNADFIGKDALDEYILLEKKRKLVGIEIVGKGIARADYPICNNEHEVIGFVTTGYKSPTLGRVLALGLVDSSEVRLGDSVYIEIRNKYVEGIIIKKRFRTKSTS